MMRLVLANKNYSSWSLRAWLYLKESGLAFDEEIVPMYVGDWKKKLGPAGKLPTLVDGTTEVWDSWAIMTYAQTKGATVGWPTDHAGEAMSVAAEMHSGFMALRGELPMNFKLRTTLQLSDDAQKDVDRVISIWTTALDRGSTFLYGDHVTIPDIMFAPVVSRFRTYGVPVSPLLAKYMDAIEALPSMIEWSNAALAESDTIPHYDALGSSK